MVLPLLQQDWADKSGGWVVMFWLAFSVVTLQASSLLYLVWKRRSFHPLCGRSAAFLSISLVGSYICLVTMMIRFGVGRDSFSCAGYILVVHVGIACLFIPYAMRTVRLFFIFKVDLAKRVFAKRRRTASRPILLGNAATRERNRNIIDAEIPELHDDSGSPQNSPPNYEARPRIPSHGAQSEDLEPQSFPTPPLQQADIDIVVDSPIADDAVLDDGGGSSDITEDNSDDGGVAGSSAMHAGALHVSQGSPMSVRMSTSARQTLQPTMVSNRKKEIPTDVLGKAYVITLSPEEGEAQVIKTADTEAVEHITKTAEDLTGIFRLPSGIQSSNLGELQRLRRWMSDSFLISRIYVPSLAVHVLIGVIQVLANSHYRETPIDEGCVVQVDLFFVLLGYFLIYVSILFYCWYILRHVNDGFFISRELRYTFWVWTLTGGVYLLISVILLARDPNASSPAYLLFVGYLGSNAVSIGWPVWLTFKRSTDSDDAGAATTGPDSLEAVLAHAGKTALLREFLIKEFSSENLLFLEDVQMYKSVRESGARVSIGAQICSQYVAQFSPLEVNIPASVKGPIEKQVANGEFTEDLFDLAYQTVFRLLESDSFQRFVKTQEYTQYRDQVVLQQSLMQTARMV